MKNKSKYRPNPDLKLMEQVRQVLRYHHYAFRTEQTYCQWIVRFIRFFDAKFHPKDMGKKEIESFLSHLATKGSVSAGTQRQALNAIVFFYKRVVPELMGHSDVKTTEIYTHVMAKDIASVASPLDSLERA